MQRVFPGLAVAAALAVLPWAGPGLCQLTSLRIPGDIEWKQAQQLPFNPGGFFESVDFKTGDGIAPLDTARWVPLPAIPDSIVSASDFGFADRRLFDAFTRHVSRDRVLAQTEVGRRRRRHRRGGRSAVVPERGLSPHRGRGPPVPGGRHRQPARHGQPGQCRPRPDRSPASIQQLAALPDDLRDPADQGPGTGPSRSADRRRPGQLLPPGGRPEPPGAEALRRHHHGPHAPFPGRHGALLSPGGGKPASHRRIQARGPRRGHRETGEGGNGSPSGTSSASAGARKRRRERCPCSSS